MNKKLILTISILCGYLADLHSAAVAGRSLQRLRRSPQTRTTFNNSRSLSTFSSQDPWYKILGISENATQKEVNDAYRVAMKKYHPDVNKDPRAQAMAKNINQAKEKANQYLQYKKDNPGGFIENIKGNADAAYAIPILAYGASKDTTSLNSDYAYLDDQYFGGMEKIQDDEIQQSAQEEFTTYSNVTSSLDKTNTDSTKNQINVPEQMQNIHNIAHPESIEQTQQIIEQDKTSHDQSEHLVEQTSTWSDYLKSTSQSFSNSITDTTTAGIQLASDNPITTAAIVGGIAITVGTTAYYWYQNHYGKKPENQDTTEKTN